MNKWVLVLVVAAVMFLAIGCSSPDQPATQQPAVAPVVEIVDYNLAAKKPLVVLKNSSDQNLKDVKVKLTAKDDAGNVLGVREGNFGITSDLAMVPGQQVGMELVLGSGEFPENSKLTWEVVPEVTTMVAPKVTVISSNMKFKDKDPVVSGEIKNEDSQTVSADGFIDYYKGSKIVGCQVIFLEDMPPGKVVSFSKTGYFLPDAPDGYRIHFNFMK